MNVYVVAFGERGEGHDPVAVFATLQQARQFAFDTWRCVPKLAFDGWHKATTPVCDIDEVWIRRMRVGGAPTAPAGRTADAFETPAEIAAHERRLDV